MPSSLAVIHSSTSGYSPRPPVSVYGTGPAALGAALAFLAGVLTCSVGLPEGAPYCRASAVAYIPSTRCSVSGRQCRSRVTRGLRRGYRNLDRFHIGCPSRVPLSPRLTLIRLALFRKPWACGARVSIARCRYSCLHFLFRTLQNTSRCSFYAVRNAPLPLLLQSRSSAPCLMPVHHPRGSARPVSCYALFE